MHIIRENSKFPHKFSSIEVSKFFEDGSGDLFLKVSDTQAFSCKHHKLMDHFNGNEVVHQVTVKLVITGYS